jgi:hypothetical protein
MKSEKLGVVFRYLQFRLILPEGWKPRKFKTRAGPGKCFTEKNVDAVLERVAEKIETDFPHWEFTMMQVGPNSYNFIYAGLKQK